MNLVQTEIGFTARAKWHSMKGFLSLQHALHFYLTSSTATVNKLKHGYIPEGQPQWSDFMGGHIQAQRLKYKNVGWLDLIK